ncbi:MAG TPA: tetratricopeptide repeat protein [Propionibacteriaceae bacterium]
MTQPHSLRGAIDLSSLGAPAAPAGSFVTEVDDASFDAAIQGSVRYPILIEFYSPRAPEQQRLSEDLAALTDEAAGRWLLVRLNVDTNAQLAAELQIKAVPTVAGVVNGQLVPLWQGTLAKEDARARIDELLRMAAKYGIVGKAQPVAAAAVAGDDGEVAMDPRYVAAYDAMEREDYAAARQEFETILAATPSDAVAKAGLAQSGLLSRVTTSNPQGAVERLAANPDDLDAILAMADVEAATGALEAAFARLVAAVRSHAGDERDIVRKRLLELYDTCDPTDSAVLWSRRELASALF